MRQRDWPLSSNAEITERVVTCCLHLMYAECCNFILEFYSGVYKVHLQLGIVG